MRRSMRPNPAMTDPWMTPAEVANALGKSVKTVRRWYTCGSLEWHRRGRLVFIRRSAMEKALVKQRGVV